MTRRFTASRITDVHRHESMKESVYGSFQLLVAVSMNTTDTMDTKEEPI